MGGRAAACFMDISDYSSEVNWRNPFFDVLWAEAIIPIETGFPTLRTQTFNPTDNDRLLERSLDLLEERRENAMVQLAYYQHKFKQGYDARVKLRPLEPGDLVLRKVLVTTKNPI